MPIGFPTSGTSYQSRSAEDLRTGFAAASRMRPGARRRVAVPAPPAMAYH
jgi:hypothetical protein